MNFTSFIFLEWFLPLFLAAYYLMPTRGKNALLTLASYVFYGWWRPDYILLMLASTLVDYGCARAMGPAAPVAPHGCRGEGQSPVPFGTASRRRSPRRPSLGGRRMRPSSIILWIIMIGVMASGLFQLKYAVQDREDQLASLNRELIASEEAVHVLHAEWSYLNRPGRLAKLAERHLDLAPMAPDQVRMTPLPVAEVRVP